MALDSSLFTLTFQRCSDDANILDLIPFTSSAEQASTSYKPIPLYSFSRAKSSDYNVQLLDHLTLLPLSSIVSPSSGDKIKQITLYNPEESVILEKKQKLFRQDWRWTWQEQEYSIRRDGHSYIVEAIRQPDPEIDIARYTAATKTRPAFLQIMDYNIQRLEVADRRGLEVLILTATCTLLDLEIDERLKDQPSSGGGGGAPLSSVHTKAKESQTSPIQVNEIHIDLHSSNESYVQHALQLMRQDQGGQGLHLIIIKATTPQVTPKAIQIAADIKLKWYRLEAVAKGRTLDPLPGSTTEIAEELYQYVRDPSIVQQQNLPSASASNEPKTAGQRRRIKLDGPLGASSPTGTPSSPPLSKNNNKSYFLPPPQQLDIYLSKERIDEFEVATPAKNSLAINRSPQHLSSSGKLETTSTPIIPPKGKQTGKQEAQSSSDSTNTSTRNFFGKLGLR